MNTSDYKDVIEAVKVSFEANSINILHEKYWTELFSYGWDQPKLFR